MKKITGVLLCAAAAAVMTACGGGGSTSDRNGSPSGCVSAVLQEQISAEEAGAATSSDSTETSGSEEPGTKTSGAEETDKTKTAGEDALAENAGPDADADVDTDADVDLTALSSTMVYSEVYNMMVLPEEYIGKTVKMDGLFAHSHDDATGKDYFACIIQDATACCSQGIEFVLTDDYTWPEDYPQVSEEICVAGVFDTYMENGNRYCTLRDAALL